MSSQSPMSFPSDSAVYFTQADNRIGGKYWKARYTEYVDATFSRRKMPSDSEAHLGILGTCILIFDGGALTWEQTSSQSDSSAHSDLLHLFVLSSGFPGPVIKAEVGDILLVTFANKADKVYSILPHGVFYDKASDAGPNVDGKSQASFPRTV